jgi:hypothetical protein
MGAEETRIRTLVGDQAFGTLLAALEQGFDGHSGDRLSRLWAQLGSHLRRSTKAQTRLLRQLRKFYSEPELQEISSYLGRVLATLSWPK